MFFTMKRMRYLFFLMTTMLFACCSSDSETKAETPASTPTPGNTKTLVAYYSYTGDSRAIANEVSGQLKCDVVEITPQDKTQKYEANNYAVGNKLLNDIKAGNYPAIDPVNVNFSNYDNIIIVTPLWHSQMAAIMQTFLNSNASAMAHKHVALIVSSHSSGISGVVSDAKRLLPDVSWMGDALWINNSNRSNTASLVRNWLGGLNFKTSNMETKNMNITIDGTTLSVVLDDNAATRELAEALKQGAITYNADDYGGFEKVGALGRSLTTSNQQITTQAGDVILYNGNQIVLFYGSNSWSYTRLGRIQYDSLDQLKSFLKAGQGRVSVTLSLPGTTAINQAKHSHTDGDAFYSLNGQRVEHPSHGVYIKKGKKVIL